MIRSSWVTLLALLVATTLATHEGCRVLWAAAGERGQALPLRPLLDAFQALDHPRLTAIRHLLRGEFTGDLDPVAAASEHMLTLVADLCDATPVVLVVDDPQWADQATIRVWERLARTASRTALLTIGITRPTPVRAELSALRRTATTVLHLEGLRDNEVTDLLAGLAGGQPGTTLRRIATEAAGNPLYLTELMAALTRAGRLRVDDGKVELERGPVPRSLLAAIADQARTAGVLGSDGKLSFRHPLVRAALYDEIPPPVRTAWHRDAARALAEAGAPFTGSRGQLLQAVTAADAGALDEVLLDWLADAAATLVAQAPGDTVILLREACRRAPATTARGARLAAKLAETQYRSGAAIEAERTAQRALAAASDPDVLVELHWTISQSRAFVGRADASLDSLGRALGLPGVSPKRRARLLVLTARADRNVGEVSFAGDLAEEALATAEEAGDRWAVAWSLHVLIVVSVMRRNSTRWRTCCRRPRAWEPHRQGSAAYSAAVPGARTVDEGPPGSRERLPGGWVALRGPGRADRPRHVGVVGGGVVVHVGAAVRGHPHLLRVVPHVRAQFVQ